MKYFGRSQKEQFDEYKDELEKIEREVFQENYKEMLRLLEAAEEADPYYTDDPSNRRNNSNSITHVQKEIRKLTKKLDAEVKLKITKHFMNLKGK